MEAHAWRERFHMGSSWKELTLKELTHMAEISAVLCAMQKEMERRIFIALASGKVAYTPTGIDIIEREVRGTLQLFVEEKRILPGTIRNVVIDGVFEV